MIQNLVVWVTICPVLCFAGFIKHEVNGCLVETMWGLLHYYYTTSTAIKKPQLQHTQQMNIEERNMRTN